MTFSEFLVLECSVRKRLGDEEAGGGEKEKWAVASSGRWDPDSSP